MILEKDLTDKVLKAFYRVYTPSEKTLCKSVINRPVRSLEHARSRTVPPGQEGQLLSEQI